VRDVRCLPTLAAGRHQGRMGVGHGSLNSGPMGQNFPRGAFDGRVRGPWRLPT